MDGLGSISPSEMQSMRSLSKQRLPIPSKHVEQLIASVDAIQKEARDKALEEAGLVAVSRSLDYRVGHSDVPIDEATANDIAAAIRALKEA